MDHLMKSGHHRLETCNNKAVAHALPIPKGRRKEFKEGEGLSDMIRKALRT